MSCRPRRRSLVASQRPDHQGFRPLAPNHPAPRLYLGKADASSQGTGASPSAFTSLQVDSLLSYAIVILGDNLSYLIGRRFGPRAERRFFAGEKVAQRRAWAERSLRRFVMKVSPSAGTSTFPMATSAAGICRCPPSRSTREAADPGSSSTREAQVSAGHATGRRPAATTACGEPAATRSARTAPADLPPPPRTARRLAPQRPAQRGQPPCPSLLPRIRRHTLALPSSVHRSQGGKARAEVPLVQTGIETVSSLLIAVCPVNNGRMALERRPAHRPV